ncbi:hypothetical protein J7L65_03530 [Candidatus Bathyarchaeota archaeon]|nr:hypothetical protein [Candidatus Bathyarchaeota archaeon]
MIFPCETVSKRILPIFRALMARKLVDRYGLTQVKAAAILGVSQPSINHYLTSKRGRLESLEEMEALERLTDELAEKVAKGLIDREAIVKGFCKFCKRMQDSKRLNEA